MAIKIAVIGASGRMGHELIKAVKEADFELAGAIDKVHIGEDSGELAGIGKNNITISESLENIISQSEVTIDFTSPQATIQNIKVNQKNNIPAVIGTTGLTDEQVEELKQIGKDIPIVFSPNMSVGVNLLFKLTELAGKTLDKGFDVEIIESHHRLKKDSPSGTANKLLDILIKTLKRDKPKDAKYGREGMVGERTDNEICVHAVRGGDIVGDHTVMFAGTGERIELTHKASSRQTFAKGAVKAAEWVKSQSPGLYSMFDVLGL